MNPSTRRRHPRRTIVRKKGGVSILFLLNPPMVKVNKAKLKDERYVRGKALREG